MSPARRGGSGSGPLPGRDVGLTTSTRKKRQESSAALTQTLVLMAGFCALFALTASAVNPSWWSLNTTPPHDYTVANQGQLKYFTAQAVGYMNTTLASSGGAGPALSNMVYNWQQDYATNGYATHTANSSYPYKPADYQAVNVGQLKYVANLVYSQLSSAGYSGLYPTWLASSNAADLNAANIGQLKEVFNFDLSAAPAAITGLNVTASSPGELDVAWSNPSMNNATAITLQYSSDAGSTWTSVTLAPNSTSYALTGLDPTKTYEAEISNANPAGANAFSSPTSGAQPGLSTPTGLSGTIENAGSTTNMDLTWTATPGAATYNIDRENVATGAWTSLVQGHAGNSYPDTTYGAGGYHYRVSAVTTQGKPSPPSAEFPQSQFAVIVVGGEDTSPLKVTNSGYVLENSGYDSFAYHDLAFAVWYNGVTTPLWPHSSGDEYDVADIGETGIVVGAEQVNNGTGTITVTNPPSTSTNNNYTVYESATWPTGTSSPTLAFGPTETDPNWEAGTPSAATITYPSPLYGVGIANGTVFTSQLPTTMPWSSDDPNESNQLLGTTTLPTTPLDLFENTSEVGGGYSDPAELVGADSVWIGVANTSADFIALSTSSGAYWYNDESNAISGYTPTGISNEFSPETVFLIAGYDASDNIVCYDESEPVTVPNKGILQPPSGQSPVRMSVNVNAREQTVGGTTGPAAELSSGPYLWQMNPVTEAFGQPFNLSDLVPAASGWTVGGAASLNDNGVIAAGATYSGSNPGIAAGFHTVLLVPITITQSNYPTPSTADSTTDSGAAGTTQTIIGAGATNNIALITGYPSMPQLTAQVGGFGSSSTLTVDWRLTVTSERSERGTKDNYSIPQTDESDVVNVPITQPWNMNTYFVAPADFFGGNVTVYFTIKNGTAAITPEQSVAFKIRGLNPLDATAKAFIQSSNVQPTPSHPDVYQFAWAVVQHESRNPKNNTVYNQFNSSGSSAELPNYGAPDGWGIAQLDTPLGVSASTEEVYNWQDNVVGFYDELVQKIATQQRFFAAVAAAYPNDPDASNPPQSTLYGQSMSALAAGAITLYNGSGAPPGGTPCPTTTLGGVTYQNPWTFTENPTSGPKWVYHPNGYDYLHQVVEEYLGESTQE